MYIPAVHQLKRSELGRLLLSHSVSKQYSINVLIPVVLLFVDQLDKGSLQGLIVPLHQSVGLWMVSSRNSVLRFETLEETFIDLVDEFSALIINEDLCAAISTKN